MPNPAFAASVKAMRSIVDIEDEEVLREEVLYDKEVLWLQQKMEPYNRF